MPTQYKCNKCGAEVPAIDKLYHYKGDVKAVFDLCTECFDHFNSSLKLKVEYVASPRKSF